MSWGVETQGFFGRLPIDQDFDNLVYRDQGSRQVGTGYHVIPLESRGVESLIIAARHPGLDVALLSYTNDASGTTGIRIYVRGSGTFYWRTYESAYPLPLQGWGMVVYNGDKQTFHSDHHYADVKNSRYYIGSSKMPLNGQYYLLNSPATPTFEYETYQNSWYQEDRSYQQTGTRTVLKTRREYQCNYESVYVYGEGYQRQQVCDWVTIRYNEEEPVYGFVTVGYWVSAEATVYCTKNISMAHHSHDDMLSETSYQTHDRQAAYAWSIRYYDPVFPSYTGSNWVYDEFQPAYQDYLKWLAAPTYTGITGHDNKLIMMR
ncbi:hypothetical protein [Chromohalobacter sp. 296-RDG]|uniref:hypothetical protein n=1 Tax=Chromohalobacter sp. 296-RDG TaxID=2994062 RepID=UPI002468567F|nr:hypothetical protein [Chromohalobacter sp. 296-RDG]